ncbi:metacaspase-1-like [Ziziphus jujuba]|uniref:Metacaspase-1-like n=1 Tax=Ziziphus jujuba TaxID=326968 RepID=A0ABM3ZRW7_ZIZJJ|nr:metacaspase-1-like [Ziziphus jujuba]
MTTSYVHNTPRLQLSDLQLKKLYSFFPQEMFSTNKYKGVVESVRIKKGKRITTRRPEKKQEENTTRRPENKQEEISPYPDSLGNIHSSFVTISRRWNKRALLCGVAYNTRKYRLKGTVNDVINMKELLINQFHYPPEFIKVMTEYEKGELIPTKHNIKNSLKWLVDGCKAGDSLVFYFSGHGLRQPDFKDDEGDGFDETICPVDFLQEGMILDSDINTDIVKPLKKGVTLHAIVDACQSGAILDLVHVYDHHKLALHVELN